MPGNKVGTGLDDRVEEGITLAVGDGNKGLLGISTVVVSADVGLLMEGGVVWVGAGEVQLMSSPPKTKNITGKYKGKFGSFILFILKINRLMPLILT